MDPISDRDRDIYETYVADVLRYAKPVVMPRRGRGNGEDTVLRTGHRLGFNDARGMWTKGRKGKCSICRSADHTRPRCPRRLDDIRQWYAARHRK